MTDSVIKYVGVDGCKGGWVGVGLSDDGGCPKIEVCKDFADLVDCFGDACVILVDIPIGLCEDGKPNFRVCDKEARGLLGELRGSVFLVPSRRFVNEVMENEEWGYRRAKKMKYADRHLKASKWSKNRYGKGIRSQAFGITWKIGEVDEFLRTRDANSPKIREVHPEICFWALNEQHPMSHKKSDSEGRKERLETLRRCAQDINGVDVDAIFKKARDKFPKKEVADDDILDALAAAITAKIGCENKIKTLPSHPWKCSIMNICLCGFSEHPPKDSKGLPMQMVYALPNDEGSPC